MGLVIVSGLNFFDDSFYLCMPAAVTANKNILSAIERIKPDSFIKLHENFYSDRKEIYKEYGTIEKSFIYLIVNKLNGKCYVGSTRSIRNRIRAYFNLAHIASQKKIDLSLVLFKSMDLLILLLL